MTIVWTRFVCGLLMVLEVGSLSLDQSAFLTSSLMQIVLKLGRNVSTACQQGLFRMATRYNEKWALKMLDATSKPGSGLLLGNRIWTGSHALCHSAVAPSSNSFLLGQGFGGQFCWINLEVKIGGNKTLPALTTGACLPNSCRPEDVQNVFPLLLPLLGAISPQLKDVTENVKMKSVSCPQQTTSLNKYTVLTFVLLTFILCLALLGTLRNRGLSEDVRPKEKVYRSADLRAKTQSGQTRSILSDILLCFSLRRNAAAILNTEERDPKLSFLHGLRVISIFWIILGHVQTHLPCAERNLMEQQRDRIKPFQQLYSLGFYAVDTFFFISAFLLGLNILSTTSFRLTARSSVVITIIRYVRTAPSMLITLAIYVHLVHPLCRGQLWFLDEETIECHAIWWTFPLYIQNYFWEHHRVKTSSSKTHLL